MIVLDLFAGIGGFSLAAHQMGWTTAQFVEREPFCQKVLNKNFPGVPIHDDIFTFSGTPLRGTIDIITGGFPCQPFSAAGKRKGREDERHLFPEMLRVIREVRPRIVVAENVYGLLNIENGSVYAEVTSCLESEGFSVRAFCLPASALGAPHRRDRLWILAVRDFDGTTPTDPRRGVEAGGSEPTARDDSRDAEHAEHDGLVACKVARGDGAANDQQSPGPNSAADAEGANGDVADTESHRPQRTRNPRHRKGSARLRNREGQDQAPVKPSAEGDASHPDLNRSHEGQCELEEQRRGTESVESSGQAVADADQGWKRRYECSSVEEGAASCGGPSRDDAPNPSRLQPGWEEQFHTECPTGAVGSSDPRFDTDAERLHWGRLKCGYRQPEGQSERQPAEDHDQHVADADHERCERGSEPGEGGEWQSDPRHGLDRSFGEPTIHHRLGAERGVFERCRQRWIEIASRTCLRGMDDGATDELHQLGSRDNRVARLKALGNGIFWPIAYEVFVAIEEADLQETSHE